MKRPLIPTCSLCSNYDPNRSICKLNGEYVEAISSDHAIHCKEGGKFLRYMNVVPDAYNFYAIDEEIPGNWSPDYSKIPSDSSGVPLIVNTKRGVERALPANDSVRLLKGDMILGVPRIYTFQGQREIIYELGVELARKEAERVGIELTVLPEEVEWTGIREFISDYKVRAQMRKTNNSWLSDEPVKGW
ncbi:hypothetical protein ACFPOG_30630 [Paenibacillus aestuarii]|uniref:Uncharacterized protein n=1 Tax=Paenibacillus aestuarii TaxID=516965 RepID=A0ABW0KH54_9BACL